MRRRLSLLTHLARVRRLPPRQDMLTFAEQAGIGGAALEAARRAFALFLGALPLARVKPAP
jgi:hypothetical protein